MDNNNRWTAFDVMTIVGCTLTLLSVMAVVLFPSDISVKVAAIVGIVAAFVWGRAQGWEDRRPSRGSGE